jgi:hypothetical protein
MLLKFNLCRAAIKVWIFFRQVALNLLSPSYIWILLVAVPASLALWCISSSPLSMFVGHICPFSIQLHCLGTSAFFKHF